MKFQCKYPHIFTLCGLVCVLSLCLFASAATTFAQVTASAAVAGAVIAGALAVAGIRRLPLGAILREE